MNHPHVHVSSLWWIAFALTLLLPVSGHAQRQFEAATWQRASGQVGVRLGTSDLMFGVGLHAGYTFSAGIYAGGLFDYFVGDDEVDVVINGLGFAEVNTSYWMLMAEGGYDFGVAKHLVLRPVVVLGVVEEAVRACSNVGCLKRSDNDAGFGFGGHVLYFVTSLVSVGGQVRAVLTGPEAVLFGIQVGGVL